MISNFDLELGKTPIKTIAVRYAGENLTSNGKLQSLEGSAEAFKELKTFFYLVAVHLYDASGKGEMYSPFVCPPPL
jgi:hypothetical protein